MASSTFLINSLSTPRKIGIELSGIKTEYEAKFQSNPTTLRQAIPAQEIWRFFVDGIIQKEETWIEFEKREKGYLLAMVRAFNLIFDSSNKLSNQFIKLLHLTVSVDVKNTNYETSVEKRGHFRQRVDRSAYFRLYITNIKNTSKDGLREMCKKVISQNAVDSTFGSISKVIVISDQRYTLAEEITDEKKDASRIYSLLENEKGHPIVWESNLRTVMGFEEKFCKLIEEFNKKIDDSDSLNKLIAIVTFIRDSEQAHPFSDCNCRTFCMLLLNFLLMRYGFPPAILPDPNRFNGYSIDELVCDVIDGMINTLDLIKNKKLYDVTSDEILEKANAEEKAYFSETVKLEIKNRTLGVVLEAAPNVSVKNVIKYGLVGMSAVASIATFGMIAKKLTEHKVNSNCTEILKYRT